MTSKRELECREYEIGVLFYLFHTFTMSVVEGESVKLRKVYGWASCVQHCLDIGIECSNSSEFTYDGDGNLQTARYDFCRKTGWCDCSDKGKTKDMCCPDPASPQRCLKDMNKVQLGTINERDWDKYFTGSGKPSGDKKMKAWARGAHAKILRDGKGKWAEPDWTTSPPNVDDAPNAPAGGGGCFPKGWDKNYNK